jgi:hypothetical protein
MLKTVLLEKSLGGITQSVRSALHARRGKEPLTTLSTNAESVIRANPRAVSTIILNGLKVANAAVMDLKIKNKKHY